MGWRGDQVQVGKVDEEGKIKWVAVGKRRNECTRMEDGRLQLDQPAGMWVAIVLDSSKRKRLAAGRGQPMCGVKRAVVDEMLQGYA